MEIKIDKTYFKAIKIKRIPKGSDVSEINLDMSLKVGFNKKYDNAFKIVFHLLLFDPTKSIELDCNFIAKFKTREPITQDFIDSNFPNINAPAIAYPFFRAAISTITLNSGFTPVILPTVNFVKFVENKNRGKQST